MSLNDITPAAITLEACHAVDVLQEAFNRHGRLEIVNTDQKAASSAWTDEEPSGKICSLIACGNR